MAFQTPITIKQALGSIQKLDYVLPAIQREFVWDQGQICRLLDSLMKGYPIGAFLFWKVEKNRSKDFTWYGFVKDYHEKNAWHCPVLDLEFKPLVAILDGQQRLTALNIALRGSYAHKEPWKRWNNPDAFPKKFLYLNLFSLAKENEQGMVFDFRFLTKEKAESEKTDKSLWFNVGQIYDLQDDYSVFLTLQNMGLGNNKDATQKLFSLYRAVHKDLCISFFEEQEQNLDKVLNIFIRVNSGGTELSYSDLLLSIATASWKDNDARQMIHGLVDDLNHIRDGFDFSKDLVLKASLMLADLPSVAFKVTNFNSKNMEILREKWEKISSSLRLAVELLASYGFTERTLTADSVLIPVAYYLHLRNIDRRYLTGKDHKADREALKFWICRTLVKGGIWGSGLDSLLVALRNTIKTHGGSGFPIREIETTMTRRGKSLRFDSDEIDDLLDSSYADKRTFSLLSLMFPHCDTRNLFHIDHVFPQARFTLKSLRVSGISNDLIPDYQDKLNRLPNLQLLEGPLNESKRSMLPADWLEETYPGKEERKNYCVLNFLNNIPSTLIKFLDYYEERRNSMATRLNELLLYQE